MAKKVFELKAECFTANKNKTGSVIQLANNVQQTEKGPASREAVNIIVPDAKTAGNFEPGKKYTITVTEE